MDATNPRFANLATGAADLLMRHRWKIWFWGDSIGLEGLLAAAELTHDERYRAYVYGLMKAWMTRQGDRSKFEYTAAGVALLALFEHCGDEDLLAAARAHADYMASFRRTQAGAYLRYEDAAIELPPELPEDHPDYTKSLEQARHVSDGGPCVFVDNMHFDGPFFAKMYAVTREDRYRQLAVDNVLCACELLADRSSHLFHHFWIERTRQPNGVLWGRGNGWAMLGLLETLEYLPPRDPAFKVILSIFQKQAAALVNLQERKGDWRTILNDPTAYLETSIAAFVVTGWSLALRRGWLSEDYRRPLDQALQAMLSHVQGSGKLAGVSYETFPSTKPEHYRQMPRDAVVPWGQGPLLTALRSYQLLVEHDRS